MKRHLLILIVIIVTACSTRSGPGEMAPDADPNKLPKIIGTYVINGVDPLGDEYGGHLTISPGDQTGEFQMQWIVVGGIQSGIGLVKGNQLIVEWQTIDGIQTAVGTAIYTITENGELYGIRTSDSLEGVGNEQAYPNNEIIP